MPVVSICDLSKYDGQEVSVRGWLYNIRSSGKIIFPILRDGSGLLQCIVFKNNVTLEVFERAKAMMRRGKTSADLNLADAEHAAGESTHAGWSDKPKFVGDLK